MCSSYYDTLKDQKALPIVHGYKLFNVIVQANYTVALSWFVRIAYQGGIYHSTITIYKCPPLMYNSNEPLYAIVYLQ